MNEYYLRDIYNTHAIYPCVHIWQIQKLTIFLLPKLKNTDISKTRTNSEKLMLFSDSATSKHPETVKIFLALKKKI